MSIRFSDWRLIAAATAVTVLAVSIGAWAGYLSVIAGYKL